jgi:hypothetical protein
MAQDSDKLGDQLLERPSHVGPIPRPWQRVRPLGVVFVPAASSLIGFLAEDGPFVPATE